ncbi:glycosyltransferase [Paenibacillus filicis]|uniref:Glycosyltransferase n=1 Tax=Paenibacillus gyeongsangnamensis TaxID=3388067 RepID=A0ABT4Q9P3_9BACL|nr:glycosyltransferase [Paenibacillus filicis]MCZ8513603.1 glycosyltransferase [Paenibacillus filicis]
MKIMLFSHICGKQTITGAEKYLLQLAAELRHDAECTLVVPEEGVLSSEATKAGIPVIVHTVPIVLTMFNPPMTHIEDVEARLRAGEHSDLITLMHRYQPDLIVANTCLNVLPAAAAKTLGIPVAWFITEKIIEHAWTPLSTEWIDRYSDWIVGISETSLRPIRYKPSTAGKIRLLPPTWRNEELHPDTWPYARHLKRSELGFTGNQQVIGYISSSIYMEKGLEHFVSMAVQVAAQRPDTRFLIVGNVVDAAYYDRCRSIIDQSGYGARFHHLGFEQRIEVLYPAMDIVVVPSLIDEGFGMTAMEGLLFGKSVVAYRSGGLEEILHATGNADLIVEKGDIAGLTSRVLTLLDIGPALGERGHASRQAVQAIFGIEAFRRRLHPLFSQFEARTHELHQARRQQGLPPLQPDALYRGERSKYVFLLEGDVKRPFDSEDSLYYYRYNWRDVTVVPDSVLHTFTTGAFIKHDPPTRENRPSVMLAKGSGRTVYLLSEGKRHPFASLAAMRKHGKDPARVVTLPDSELEKLPLGEKLKDNGERKARRRRKLKGRQGKLKLVRRRMRRARRMARWAKPIRSQAAKRLLRGSKRSSRRGEVVRRGGRARPKRRAG